MIAISSTKNIIIGILLLIVATVSWQYFNAWTDLKAKIKHAEDQMQQLETSNQNLQVEVSDLSSQQEELNKEILENKNKVQVFQDKIGSLNSELVIANKKVVSMSDDQAIADSFKEAFDLTDANVKVITYAEPTPSGRLFKNTFLAMPIDIAKLPITSKNTESACLAEVAYRKQIEGLQSAINKLTNDKLDLEREKAQAWSSGYDEAYGMYVEINGLYLELLRAPPKVEFGSSWMQIVGGLSACALLSL